MLSANPDKSTINTIQMVISNKLSIGAYKGNKLKQ